MTALGMAIIDLLLVLKEKEVNVIGLAFGVTTLLLMIVDLYSCVYYCRVCVKCLGFCMAAAVVML